MDALLLGLLFWFVTFFGAGLWIVWPVEKVARRRQGAVRYSIADFMCLFISIQVPLGIVVWYNSNVSEFAFPDDDERVALVRTIGAVFFVVGVVVWWGAVRAISFCGVNHGWRRMLFLGVIVPTVYYGLMPFSLCVMSVIGHAIEGELSVLLAQRRWVVAASVFLGCALIVCGVLIRQVVLAGTPEAQASHSPGGFETDSDNTA